MHAFTVFTRRANGQGSTHINTVEVEDYDAKQAAMLGREVCAFDWELEPECLHVIGIVEGSVSPVCWDDEECLTTY